MSTEGRDGGVSCPGNRERGRSKLALYLLGEGPFQMILSCAWQKLSAALGGGEESAAKIYHDQQHTWPSQTENF